MTTVLIQADDQSLCGHIARAHVDLDHRTVTIGVSHMTFGDGDEPSDQGWNVHLDLETARSWARALVAALDGGEGER